MHLFRFALYVVALLLLAALAVSALSLIKTRERIAALEAERSLAETRHGQIEYISWGEGPPVLVVHGAGGGFEQGRLLAHAIGGDGFRWISVSRFGYLGSAMPEAPSTDNQAEAFVDLLDTLGVERVNILAMSGGVPPSLKFAEMFPDRVDRMMLLSSAPITPFAPAIADRPIPTWAYAALLGNDVVYWTLSKTMRGQLESRRLAGVNNEGAAVDPSATYELERIRARVVVVHARDDRLNPFEVGSTIADRIPQSRFLALDRGGHLLLGHHAELHTEFERLLTDRESG